MAAVITPERLRTIVYGPLPGPAAPPPMYRMRFAQRDIQPPAAFRVTPDDSLVLGVRNALAGVNLACQARLWTDEGDIVFPEVRGSPTSDRVLHFTAVQLHYGYLVSAAMWATGGTLPRRGQTYATMQVVRPPLAAFNWNLMMAAGYITGSKVLAWPYGEQEDSIKGPGMLYSIFGTTPAVTTDWTQVVPTGAVWRVRGIRANLTTSAVAGNRQVLFWFDDGATTFFHCHAQNTQGPGTSITYHGVPAIPYTAVINITQPVFLPPEVLLFEGWRFGVVTVGMQAGDQWGQPHFLIEEELND